MNVYTVHLKGSPEDPAALERVILIREGFSWWALLFGPFWLLWNRLWLALAVWLVLDAIIVTVGSSVVASRSALTALHLLMHFALAMEAAQIRRGSVARRGFRFADVVHGHRIEHAERVFFERASRSGPVSREQTNAGAHRLHEPGMVGLFPSSGA